MSDDTVKFMSVFLDVIVVLWLCRWMFLFLVEACRIFRVKYFDMCSTLSKNMSREGGKKRERERWGAWERQANAAKVNHDLILVKTVWVLIVYITLCIFCTGWKWSKWMLWKIIKRICNPWPLVTRSFFALLLYILQKWKTDTHKGLYTRHLVT